MVEAGGGSRLSVRADPRRGRLTVACAPGRSEEGASSAPALPRAWSSVLAGGMDGLKSCTPTPALKAGRLWHHWCRNVSGTA